MAASSDRPQTYLRRRELAQALTKEGFPVAESTLATIATRGGGPPFRKFGRYPLYPLQDALSWARARLGPIVRSTSEFDRTQGGSSPAGLSEEALHLVDGAPDTLGG